MRLKESQLGLMGPPPQVPIYVAAIGPKMIELAGEVADGVMGFFYSLKYFRETFLARLEKGSQAGRAQAGRY